MKSSSLLHSLLRNQTIVQWFIWFCVIITLFSCCFVVFNNITDLSAQDNLLTEIESAQTSLESVAEKLISRAGNLVSKIKELEQRRMKLKQSKREIRISRDAASAPAAIALASLVHDKLSQVKKMVHDFTAPSK